MALTHITRLAFGRAIPTGEAVSDAEWRNFAVRELAPRFPDGFTVIHVEGGWRDAATGQTIREPSTIVEVAHGGSDEERRAILALARAYKLIFQQDAVMATTVPATVEFI